MAQYFKVQIINQLQSQGVTAWLYKLGIANSKSAYYANAYNFFDAQKRTGQTRGEAVKITATKFKTTRRTVYNIIKDMEGLIEVPTAVEKLLSTNPVPRK